MLLQFSGGFVELAGPIVAAAGSLVLLLMVVALGGYAYKQLRGDGVEWPDEDPDSDDGVTSGEADDEWDYY